MNEKRTLTIDPKLFNFSSNNTTRKKRNSAVNQGGIKIKTNAPQKKNESLKKKSILKMIRNLQEDRNKTLFNNKPANPAVNADVNTFNKEFKEATSFFENLTEKTEQSNKMNNYSLKHRTPVSNSLLFNSAISPINEIVNINLPNELHQIRQNPIKSAMPHYGCLKNGTLPTFKNFMNSTQKQRPHIQTPSTVVSGNLQSPRQPIIIGGSNNPSNIINPAVSQPVINDGMNRINTMNQIKSKINELNPKVHNKIHKQKRTLRRTYKIGKSKVFPRVSVLVSNKTLRNNISTKTQLLKQTPIQDVKKYLMKRNFIKVGSTAPNDVLRKMYESATLICGEVQNHNPDNLLYNFMNGGEA
jgi:hypothetical protein